jgi:hypothetical protein
LTAAQRSQLQSQMWQSITDETVRRDGLWVYLLLKHWQAKPETLLSVGVGETLKGKMTGGPCLTYRRVA